MLRLLEYAVFGELSIRQVEIARENLLADDTGSAGAVCFANRFTLQDIVTGSQSTPRPHVIMHTNFKWSDMIAREFTDLT